MPAADVELEGTIGVVDTRKSTRTWSAPTASHRLARSNAFWGCPGHKKRGFRAQNGPDLGLPGLADAPGTPPTHRGYTKNRAEHMPSPGISNEHLSITILPSLTSEL